MSDGFGIREIPGVAQFWGNSWRGSSQEGTARIAETADVHVRQEGAKVACGMPWKEPGGGAGQKDPSWCLPGCSDFDSTTFLSIECILN